MDLDYSVLMSVYKNDKSIFLEEAIGDILNQTLQFKEFILVIDGEINLELEVVISKFIKSLTIVRLKKNVGLGNALQFGLQYCNTELVMRMDSDDRCSPERAALLIDEMQKNDCDVIGSSIKEFNLEINDIGGIIRYKSRPSYFDIYNYVRDPIGHASVLFKKSKVLTAGGYLDCLYFEDTYLWLRMNNLKMILLNIPQILYFARVSDGFEGRRGGFKYMLLEVKHFWKFKKLKLISLKSFILNVISRPVIRILPPFFLRLFYRSFLRSKI